MHLHTKEHQRGLANYEKLGEAWSRHFLRAFKRIHPCQLFGLGLLASRTGRKFLFQSSNLQYFVTTATTNQYTLLPYFFYCSFSTVCSSYPETEAAQLYISILGKRAKPGTEKWRVQLEWQYAHFFPQITQLSPAKVYRFSMRLIMLKIHSILDTSQCPQ